MRLLGRGFGNIDRGGKWSTVVASRIPQIAHSRTIVIETPNARHQGAATASAAPLLRLPCMPMLGGSLDWRASRGYRMGGAR